ncbi:MAG: hypothetical protein HYX97_07590 [Chloroflexi bacterium]|nr:hypothetical protein [Chloroflexota bacterium]
MNKKAKAQSLVSKPKTKRTTSKAWDNRRRALLAASKDPLFLQDVAAVGRDFAYADAEAAREDQNE